MKHPLQEIPGIGKALALDLLHLGIHAVDELKGKDPEKLYKQLEKYEGVHQDRCVLYTFRCAIYYAENRGKTDPEKLKWRNRKD